MHVTIEFIDDSVAFPLLAGLGLEINDWGQIVGSNSGERNWRKCFAPNDARELQVFCRHVVGHLPRGDWYVLKINDATVLDAVEELALMRAVHGPSVELDSVRSRAILIRSAEEGSLEFGRLALVDLFDFFLRACAHVHVVSSASVNEECIGLQDGFAYFYSRNHWSDDCYSSICDSDLSLQPKWILDVLARLDGFESIYP